jgi:hypothetical protein
MTDRIKQLAQQAKDSIPMGTLGVAEWIELYNQTLAELIVLDCADHLSDRGEFTSAESIKAHFGINR